MVAMHDDVLEAMVNSLKEKCKTMERLIPFDMTHDECIRLVAPSEHISILKDAAKYADVRSSEAWMSLQVPAEVDGVIDAHVLLKMRTHAERTPPLMPRNPWWQPFQHGEKVVAWLTKRYELGRRFGTAQHVLRRLNIECDTGQQLRFLMPSVLQLCKSGVNPRMDRWMAKHASYRPVRHTPAMSPDFKRAVQDTSALLTSAMLIGNDVPERLPGEVDIGQTAMAAFKIDKTLINRM